MPVFGLLKRSGRGYAVMIPNAKESTLSAIMKRRIQPDSIVSADGFPSYDALDVSSFHHIRINHSERFADKQDHVNGIENFWNQAKRPSRRFNGIPRRSFCLFLKECGWRFGEGSHRHPLNRLQRWSKTGIRTLGQASPTKSLSTA